MKKSLSFLLFCFVFSLPVFAAKENDNDSCKTISKAKAISSAQRAIEGKALSASLIKSRGPAVYRVKVLLDNGRVKTILVDGCSGKVIQVD